MITDTASVHAAAWKNVFDDVLRERAARDEREFRPFDADGDYRRHVDGKPRYDGVESFLASRGIRLPRGAPDDPPERETVCGIGNRKDEEFRRRLAESPVTVFADTVALVRSLRGRGIRTAVISASRNCVPVLRAAGVEGLFEERVDGLDADSLGLPGKPDPAVFLEAARRLGVVPERAAVVEDALAGVEAGRRGGFALVVGVDRTGHPDELLAAGAGVVAADLSELMPGPAPIRGLRSASTAEGEILAPLRVTGAAVFLDYDGTLTPIVATPEEAILPAATREALARLAAACPVAIVSGRDLDEVRALVGLDGLYYAGSHGFDLAGPGGFREQRTGEFLAGLDRVDGELRDELASIAGTRVERKRFAVAVHYRQAAGAEAASQVEAIVRRVAAAERSLTVSGGKMVFELRPAVPWDKGRAVDHLLSAAGLGRAGAVPVYVGDDVTDEDAFREVRARGLGIAVRGESDERETLASYTLEDPGAVRRFLLDLAEALERGDNRRR